MEAQEMDVIKEIPGYKVILKAVIKAQIQQLVEQLALATSEESIILTASVADGTLSHIGSNLARGFLEDHEDVKSNFLGFCLKRQHEKQQQEEKKRQEMRKSAYQLAPLPQMYPQSRNSQLWPRGPGPGAVGFSRGRSAGVRHEPYPRIIPQNFPSSPTTPVKYEPSDTSNDSFGDSNNVNQSASRLSPREDNQSYAGGGESDSDQNEIKAGIKVEAISESDLELEITGVEPGKQLIQQNWNPNDSADVNFAQQPGAGGSRAEMHQTQSEVVCTVCGKRFKSKQNRDIHLRIHSGERPYRCDICLKTFRVKSHLKSHMVTHIDKTQLLQ